ncbi:hypothetical protein MRB53_010283 [Persea americana]|uniref:Uncharacterized protein n=1 Tax=Persea americana TaxID=3435 RepID=A0ACC2LRH4_PERAE|nr:hypothetical protein MRB53_010283 [Persea americana]
MLSTSSKSLFQSLPSSVDFSPPSPQTSLHLPHKNKNHQEQKKKKNRSRDRRLRSSEAAPNPPPKEPIGIRPKRPSVPNPLLFSSPSYVYKILFNVSTNAPHLILSFLHRPQQTPSSN